MRIPGEGVDIVRHALERLSETGAFGRALSDDSLHIFVPRNRFKRPAMHLSAEQFRTMRSAEWLVPHPTKAGAYVLSPLGKARLSRCEKNDLAFQQQHQELRTVAHDGKEATGRTRRVNVSESPLSRLHSRKSKNGKPLISRDQFEAGEKLRRDFTFANMSPRVTGSWEEPTGGGRRRPMDPAEVSDNVIAAKQRFFHALDAVGPELSDILVDVCCHLHGVEQVERKAQWPARSGKVVLGIALNRLADHYGLVATGPRRSATRSKRYFNTPAE